MVFVNSLKKNCLHVFSEHCSVNTIHSTAAYLTHMSQIIVTCIKNKTKHKRYVLFCKQPHIIWHIIVLQNACFYVLSLAFCGILPAAECRNKIK